jgi:WD40 repeat protein/serine/threonine protein kinase
MPVAENQDVPMSKAEDKNNKQPSEDELPSTASLGAGAVRPGGQIGPYKLLNILGEGGFAVVYLAEQQKPVKRRVALKVIKPGMDTKIVIARFEAERQALALLDHPNIAHVYDAGTTEAGRPYFAMEYIKGVPIIEHCDGQKLTIEERLKLFLEVCEAIQHAHQKAIIHRDIKPSNILVLIEGKKAVPKVIDFGIAKALSQPLTERTLVTEQGQFVGTPEYMSPEQADLTSQDIDTRSDIYSLGVVLYELLTGVLPFDAKMLREGGVDHIRHVIRDEEPKTPSTRLTGLGEQAKEVAARRRMEVQTLRRQLHKELEWIPLKAMRKERSHRYRSASELADDIRNYLDGNPLLAGPESVTYRFRKFVWKHAGAVATLALMAAVIILGLVVSTTMYFRAEQARQKETAARTQAQQAQANEARLRRQAEAQAYASDMSLAQQALALNNLGQAEYLLNRHRPKPGEKDLRGWEWRYLWKQCRSDELFTLYQESESTVSLAVSPDGKWLAVVGYGGWLSIWDLTTHQKLCDLSAVESGVRAVFSPCEPLLAFGVVGSFGVSTNQESSVRLWDGKTREIVAELTLSGECAGLEFSEDGQTLVTASIGDTGQVTLWSVSDRRKLVTHSLPLLRGRIPCWPLGVSRDLRLAACRSNSALGSILSIVELDTGKICWSKETTGGFVSCVFSPDGKILATSSGFAESVIRLWDVASGREFQKLKGHRGYVEDVLFWPDGTKLASASADQTICLWDLNDITNIPPPRTLRGHRDEVWRLALLPDRKTLVSGSKDGSVRFWDTAIIGHGRTYTRLPTLLRSWCFDTDSRSVLTVDRQGKVSRRHGTDFQQMQTLFEVDTNSVASAFSPDRFSPDRRLLATALSNGVVQVWDIKRCAPLQELAGHTKNVFPIEFLSQETKLVVLHPGDGSLHEWDLSKGQETQLWRGVASPSAVAFSPDERWCLMFSYNGANLLRDMATGRETNPNLKIGTTESAAFSPDGRIFTAASFNSIARVWETASLREVATLRRFLLGAHSVAFSPDGTRLASSSTGPETIKLWSVESHQEVLTLESEQSRFVFSAFSPDGNVLGSLSMEGFLHLWRAPSFAEIDAIEKSNSTNR